jgi:catechol 2,3-dioxygenase-like lactoylglutathione lyase family enzyme
MQPDIRLSQISAIMLGVRDLPQARVFYENKLGLKVVMQTPQLVLFECGSVLLGLSPGHARAGEQIAGATEVVFRVASVRQVHRGLTERGVCFVSQPHQATPADWVAHFRDTEGHLLSIFGPEGQDYRTS